MMPATPSPSSMATIGRAVTSKSAKIALLALQEATAAVVGLAAAVASAVASAAVEALPAVVDLEVVGASAEVLVDLVVQVSTRAPLHSHRIPSLISLLLVGSPATPSMSAISHGLRATKISSSSSLPLVKSSVPRSSTSPMVALVVRVWSNLRRLLMLRRLFVSLTRLLSPRSLLTLLLAKFTGYQYGGRPLGLTYVKYTNQNNGDAMEGTEHTGGLTQDQIM